jgi:2-dehydro-3-deoxyphosphogluconate aldolase/(4S)-4-hydroxy-2-oxoglutarate aldolase
MNPILEQLARLRIIPVVVIDDESAAEPLARALRAGGLPTMEITFRTDAAKRALTRIAEAFPDLLLGAGTVLTIEQVKTAVDSGAKYIVSPGLNPKVVGYCLKNGITVTPGVVTPTEIESAIELGLDVVKFFPAEAVGGLPYLKAICAPYRKMKFIPTGGIDESNLPGYLSFAPVAACGGSWMVKADLIHGRRFDEITALAARAVGLVQGVGGGGSSVP